MDDPPVPVAGGETSVNEEEHLDGEDVLPGFSCRLISVLRLR